MVVLFKKVGLSLGWLAGLMLAGMAQAGPAKIVLGSESLLHDRVGEEVILEGVLQRVETLEPYGHRKLFLADGNGFYLFIDSEQASQFPIKDLQALVGQTIFVAGQVKEVQGTPHIVLSETSQIGPDAKVVKVPETPVSEADPSEEDQKATAADSDEVVELEGVVSMGTGTPDMKLTARQTSIKALVVRSNHAGMVAGQASKLTATALVEPKATLTFNQEVGESMQTALGEVGRFIRHRHGGWPTGEAVTLGFTDKYIDKDGPSAAMACALLLDSMITGDPIPEYVAVTGDLNADGRVLPIGGVKHKVEGAINAGCQLILIPVENVPDILDMAKDGDFEKLCRAQIVAVANFDEAKALLNPEADSPEAQGLGLFAQSVVGADRLPLARNQRLRDGVAKVGALIPQHASAYALYLSANQQLPERFSLRGSLSRIDALYGPFRKVVASASQGHVLNLPKSGTRGDIYTETTDSLRELKREVDPQAVPLLEALIDFVEAVRRVPSVVGSRSQARIDSVREELRTTADRIDAAEKKLMALPALNN